MGGREGEGWFKKNHSWGKRSDEEVNQGAASQEYTDKNLALPVTNSESLTQLGFS